MRISAAIPIARSPALLAGVLVRINVIQFTITCVRSDPGYLVAVLSLHQLRVLLVTTMNVAKVNNLETWRSLD